MDVFSQMPCWVMYLLAGISAFGNVWLLVRLENMQKA